MTARKGGTVDETTVAPPVVPVPRRLYRDPQRRLLQGVAAGIAEHLGLRPVTVRAIFVVLLPFTGVGALLYVVFWAVLPDAPSALPPRRRRVSELVPYIALAAGVLLLWSLTGFGGFSQALGWLVALIAAGAGLIWHLADPDRRKRWSRSVPGAPWMGAVLDEKDRRSYALRLIGGGALVIVGIIGTIAVFSPLSGAGIRATLASVVFAFVALGGVALVLAPLLWKIFSQLREERVGRIREAERAELAAMIHDQVLHTLALIQRNAGDVKAVQRLARGQERSLRNWLYKPTGVATETFAAAIEQAVAEVEDTYTIVVESVVVGEARLTNGSGRAGGGGPGSDGERGTARAGRHRIALCRGGARAGECVRSGPGGRIRPVHCGGDRHGVRGSIIARMERHGGRAEIRTSNGEGTEVRLFMPQVEGRVMTEVARACGYSWWTTTRCSGPAYAPSWAATSRSSARPVPSPRR